MRGENKLEPKLARGKRRTSLVVSVPHHYGEPKMHLPVVIL